MLKSSVLRNACPLLFFACPLLLISPAIADEQIRSVRETGGYIEQKGWESSLVRANPNLNHFMWSPMTTMIQVPTEVRVQTSVHVTRQPGQERGCPANRDSQAATVYRHSRYRKPNHIAMQAIVDHPNKNDLSGQVLPRRYVKPNKIDVNALLLPKNDQDLSGQLLPRRYVKPIHEDVYATLANREANARLLNRGQSAGLPGSLPVATYSNDGFRAQNTTAYRAKADVCGTVVSRGNLLRSH